MTTDMTTPDFPYRMEIVEDETGEVVKSLPASSMRQAERLENGANRNLNHNKYFTRIVESSKATS